MSDCDSGSAAVSKLHRLLVMAAGCSRQELAAMLPAGRVLIDGHVATALDFPVTRFHSVTLNGKIIQAGQRALYVMVHKPVGYVSATVDSEHPTVVSLVDDPDTDQLHLAGRLDRNTSGLVLLTNDGTWSKRITAADFHVPKVYQVTTAHEIQPEAVSAFAAGFYFHTEGITTLPAKLEILGPREARVTLHEGRYHQIKRMFHRVQNRVEQLHRVSIGGLALPSDLPAGGWRWLTPAEQQAVFH
jgi:16S rRNA pseudouridine516 synthase